ncbi:MAG: IS4 family transposase [Burkholderiales bacterium]|nr:IS4 family transposase [Burkholderiales bacterium]
MLIHLAQGFGLRETAVMAEQGGLAKLSDVAVLKRLKGCEAWFEWMAFELRQKWLPTNTNCGLWADRRIRLVDGSIIKEPGVTGSQWRLHYSVGLPSLDCQEVILSTPKEGETLRRFSVNAGDVFIADRCYANARGVAHVVQGGGDVIIRCNLVTLPLYDRLGNRLQILSYLRDVRVGQCMQWPVQIKCDKQWIKGRLCAIKKDAVAAKKAQARVKRESVRNQRQLQDETLEAANYVFVFTTLPEVYSASMVMELYRGRWQIELVFKRLKSLLQLGHLKKHDDNAARAWLQGKLLVAFLIDALLVVAERFSPWGYLLHQENSQPLFMARDGIHV